MEREEVEVNKNVRPISSHLEGISFVDKDLLWPKRNLLPLVSGPAGEIPSLFHALSLNVSCANFKKTLFSFSQPRPQGFSLKNWDGRPTHFLREKPWGRG